MRKSVKTAAYNLLSTLSKEEIKELVDTLTYFNDRCKESDRAECMRIGCEKGDRVLTEGEKRLMEKAAGAEIYMSGDNSVCPCCKQ